MAVSKRLRFEVMRRDNHACRYCGATAPAASLTIDHVVPVALGGTDVPTNLVTACRDCNAGKTSSSPDAALLADVSADAIRWAAAMKQVTAQATADRETREAWHSWFREKWTEWTYGGAMAREFPLDADWEGTVDRFFLAGLTPDDLSDAIRNAMGKSRVTPDDKFRYFCGVCWGVLTDRQTAARALLNTESSQDVPQTNPYASDEAYALMQMVNLSLVCDGGF